MPLIFIEGFDDLTNWTLGPGTMTLVAGRNGNGVSGTVTNRARYQVPAAQESEYWTAGVAFRLAALPSTPGLDFLSFASDSGGVAHVRVRCTVSGALEVLRSTTSLGAPTANGIVLPATWHYLELQSRTHDTLGTAVVRLDGVEVLNLSALDTKQAGTKVGFDSLILDCNANGATIFDDLYLSAGVGSADAFLGDCRVETLYPAGNGSINQFTGSDGNSTDNYLLVDEVGAPNTADYVANSTTGQRDEYALSDLSPTTQSVLGVQPIFHIAKTDTSSRAFKPFTRKSGSATVGPTTPIDTTFRNYPAAVATVDPDTGAAWTVANVNALNVGLETV